MKCFKSKNTNSFFLAVLGMFLAIILLLSLSGPALAGKKAPKDALKELLSLAYYTGYYSGQCEQIFLETRKKLGVKGAIVLERVCNRGLVDSRTGAYTLDKMLDAVFNTK